MALSTENNRQSFTAVENQTKFTFTIPYFDTTDIGVQQQASDGTITILSYNANPSSATQFKVDATNNNPADGGTVTLGAAATTGDTYVVIRDVPYTQQYDLQEGSTIDPTALNKALDRVVAQNQQQNDALDRSIVFPATDPDTITYDVDSTTNRANKALGFDALGNITELDLASSGTVSGNTNAGIEVTNNQISARIDTDSLEFNSGKINVKNSGINTSEIANDAVTNAKIDASAVGTTEIADDAVTYAKIQDITTSNSVLGNTSTGTVAERALVGDILLDEDDMSTDSNTKGATQQSIKAYVDSQTIGVGQTWQGVTRAFNTDYTNDTGKPIMAHISGSSATDAFDIQITLTPSGGSALMFTLVRASNTGGAVRGNGSIIIPNNTTYRWTFTGQTPSAIFVELR